MVSFMAGRESEKICPRCGMKFSYVEERRIGNNSYFYAVHVSREGKKRRVRKCYLGPSGSYVHVSHLHRDEGLELKGLMDRNRAIEYMNRLIDYITLNYSEIWGTEEAAALALRNLASRLLNAAQRIAPQTTPQQERIELSEQDYNAIMLYYGKRVKCPEAVRKRAKELFERIFSKGEKILVIR
jgi:uncharacterized protein (DUF1778 family)